ncbi:MAG: stringent starvation protein A [Gammaproteobacteria bacterium]|nr:stringent starvation protein A [Gammaproteobacteria bacterium]NIR82242.1 stringent starvation protein A [Gammaproteobacteria bacterium]NIR91060.1 stringent starvation protein A [Gammaproteobacteria bacterium]NIU03391.1 stringent starvation protein A [Gammaproteobacteria bacterium]NIV50884.1 stringent starvation protein A [Gammaproteobacteria bacterium]
MALIANRRSVMTLFSAPNDPYSHCTRLVVAEKGITVEIQNLEPGELPEDLLELNPYQSLPTLVDRELVLYEPRLIMEYLDERFPHPPLMPVDPVSRAKSRLAMYRVDRDWYELVGALEGRSQKEANKARKIMRESLTASADVFSARPYFLSDEFSLVDCMIAPLLWRLPHWGIELPAQAKPVREYAERLFERPAFEASLTEAERELRA